LIALCCSCHSKTNKDHKVWTWLFVTMLQERGFDVENKSDGRRW
jgi:hypothetical protein